jgi:hypothetical protein
MSSWGKGMKEAKRTILTLLIVTCYLIISSQAVLFYTPCFLVDTTNRQARTHGPFQQ